MFGQRSKHCPARFSARLPILDSPHARQRRHPAERNHRVSVEKSRSDFFYCASEIEKRTRPPYAWNSGIENIARHRRFAGERVCDTSLSVLIFLSPSFSRKGARLATS